ncbi:MAG: helix-turn-helix domain-containing protein [Thaumarchaeota archaeon]|nr:helix-turn-helix domain-containing protein [Candidatus Calditenuaceae archaeon]MDW8041539.1 helix-turn-helix domain-containing protein [Nitrososphaerota archaeon]
MIKVRARMPISCPWARRLRTLGNTCEVVTCVPRVKSLGVNALVKVRSSTLGRTELSETVSKVQGVERALFFEGNEKDSYIGMVRTKTCACARAGIPFNRLIAVRESGGSVEFEILFEDPNEFSEFVRESNARGYSAIIEEIKHTDKDMPQLTRTQMQLLAAALHMGFYEVPKRAGTRELAHLFGTSPRAVSEALRRAHKKLVMSTISATEI